MKLLIAAIGKAKAGPEQQLYLDYVKRLPWKLELRECKDEAGLLAACKGYDRIVALDESGKTLSSEEFAGQIQNWQQQGNSSFAFIIGAADGLSDEVRGAAHMSWSLGRVTWPHMLVRGLLAEQLYRTYSIIANHPYHRA
jgi:23S rRNA (pseudouridine1915-N3)-methyltransferase